MIRAALLRLSAVEATADWLEERPIEVVEVVEAPSERTLARAMRADEGRVLVDLPPGRRAACAVGDRRPTRSLSRHVPATSSSGASRTRCGIAAGPEARLYRDGLDEYGKVLRRMLRAI